VQVRAAAAAAKTAAPAADVFEAAFHGMEMLSLCSAASVEDISQSAE